MPITWNGQKDDVVSVKRDDVPTVKAPVVYPDKLTGALRRATTRFNDRPDHHRHCFGVHCLTHPVLFPSQGDREFCLVQSFYTSSRWPYMLMCRQCADLLELVGDMGILTPHPLA